MKKQKYYIFVFNSTKTTMLFNRKYNAGVKQKVDNN